MSALHEGDDESTLDLGPRPPEIDDSEPQLEDCPHCDGVGCTIGSWPSGGVDCRVCGGSGLVPRKGSRR